MTEEEASLLERVRQQQGLNDLQQAAEWLVKVRLRRAVQREFGTHRALYPVPGGRR
nr:hypothetical protein 5 [Saccharospirillaceae bacterium]